MNRRDFLKRLSLGIGAIFAGATVLKAMTKEPEVIIEKGKWYQICIQYDCNPNITDTFTKVYVDGERIRLGDPMWDKVMGIHYNVPKAAIPENGSLEAWLQTGDQISR